MPYTSNFYSLPQPRVEAQGVSWIGAETRYARDGKRGLGDVGVVLTPIITKDTISLDALRGRTLAVDGNGELYQFLALIRLRDGTPLRDSKGRITSHLSGLFYRSTRLMADHGGRLAVEHEREPHAVVGHQTRAAI